MEYKREIGGEYEFVDREGRLVRSTREGLKSLGKAYGFVDCSASVGEIEAELPEVREDTKTPSELELSLKEGIDGIKGDSDLRAIAILQNPKYTIEATYPGATNKETAEELTALLINTSNSLFCQTDEHIRGKVTYKENEKYVFME